MIKGLFVLCASLVYLLVLTLQEFTCLLACARMSRKDESACFKNSLSFKKDAFFKHYEET